jgi:hypothetical protein
MFKSFPSLSEILKDKEVIKIYSGKDDYCRCGCGGKYHYPSARMFKAMLRRADEALYELRWADEAHQYRFMQSTGYINIPIYNEARPKQNRCYCVYFKNKEKVS